jgi:glycosyltransferase involved in cell wall biosynthesis
MYRILAFTVKPRESADTRYRILQYQAIAERDGVRIDHRSLMGPRYFQWQIEHSHLLSRLLLYPVLLAVRLWQVLLLAPRYDAVWVSREMAPLGPPVFEQLLVWLSKRVVLDVDDALHISDKKSSSLIPRLLRDRGKFGRMASSYSAVVCGNEYLADYYRSHGGRVAILPTVVEAARYARSERSPSSTVRIGWIGTPLNRHHVEFLHPALTALAQERPYELVLVGLNQPLDGNLPNVRYRKWKLAEELDYFSEFDIGIMPLLDSPFARGKCAFKLVQYMAAGIPVVASPVGANSEVVQPDRNGFLADTQDEWLIALRTLIDDPALRHRMGAAGREMVRSSFSVEGLWPRYAAILTGKPLNGATHDGSSMSEETACAV